MIRFTSLARLALSEYFVLALTLVWLLAMLPFVPGLGTPENLKNIVSSALPLLILAVGQTIVMISGGIDLSVTAVIAWASITGGLTISADGGLLAGHALAPAAGVIAMLACGLFAGLLNGLAVAVFRIPAFLATLTSMTFFGGLAIWMTKSKNLHRLPEAFNAIGREMPLSALVTVLVAVLAWWLLRGSNAGRWFYALGANPRAALVSGVPVKAVTFAAYAASGLCAALASVLYTGRLETASPVMGQRVLLDVIGAVVIGGVSLTGGRGELHWTAFGVFFMTVIDNSLNLLGLSNFGILMAKGLVILAAALVDSWRNRYAAA